jgi:hypothetical protein
MENKLELYFTTAIEFILVSIVIYFFLVLIIRFIIGFYFEDNCPSCGKNTCLERLPSNKFNKLIPFVYSKYFKCLSCYKSFYKRQISEFSLSDFVQRKFRISFK